MHHETDPGTSAQAAGGRAPLDPIPALLGGATGLWAAVLAVFALARHQRLNSTTYDLGIKAQVIWNTFQGRLFASSVEVEHYLGDHVQLIMLLLAPLYGLWADVRILLIVQSLLLALGAVPVYRIARRTLPERRLALALALAYLLYPTIGFVNRFDFHPLTFVILFLLAAYDLLEAQRPGWATLLIVLALSTREDVGITVFALGVFVALARRRQWPWGVLWAVAGLSWSLIAIFAIIPFFRGEASDTVARYAWLGEDVGAIARTLLTSPGLVLAHIFGTPYRWHFLLKLLLPLGFLPLLAPEILLVGAPALAYNLLSSTPSQSSIYFQYVSPVIPFLFIAAIRGISRLRPRLAGALGSGRRDLLVVGWLAAGVVLAWALDNPFTQEIRAPYYPVYALEQRPGGDAFYTAHSLLPPAAPVATMMAYGPHLALRPELHLFHDVNRRQERAYGFPQSEYLLLNLTDLRWGVNARLFYAMIETAIGHFGYEVLYFADDVALLQRDAPPQPATGALLQRVIALLEAGGKYAPAAPETLAWMGRQWVREALPPAATPAAVAFGDGVSLLGYTLSAAEVTPGRPLCATLYWAAREPLENDYTVFLHLVAPDGYVHAQRDSVPALGFYGTRQWGAGEVVADMHCFQVPSGLTPGAYFLNAGLYDPATGERLLPEGGAAETVPGAIRLAPVTVTPE